MKTKNRMILGLFLVVSVALAVPGNPSKNSLRSMIQEAQTGQFKTYVKTDTNPFMDTQKSQLKNQIHQASTGGFKQYSNTVSNPFIDVQKSLLKSQIMKTTQ